MSTWSWRPLSGQGRVAVAAALGFVASFAGLSLLTATGERGGDTIADNWRLGVPALLAAACGIAALATGVAALSRHRDRSVLVVLSTVIGAMVTLFIAAELAFPH